MQQRIDLVLQLTRREIEARYRGSLLGLLWSVVTPLFMLIVFTFVFGVIFKTRWSEASGGPAATETASFALTLFAGLIVFNLFADVVNRASTLIINQRNLVKKVVFPLELLPIASLLSALLQASISFIILLVAQALIGGGLSWTVLLTPIVILPACILGLGFSWFLAALGVYLRDIQHAVPPLVTALMFLTPVFYPPTALPEGLGWLVQVNPLAYAVNDLRTVTVFGAVPEPTHWLLGLLLALAVALLGYAFFTKTRKGFADVL